MGGGKSSGSPGSYAYRYGAVESKVVFEFQYLFYVVYGYYGGGQVVKSLLVVYPLAVTYAFKAV